MAWFKFLILLATILDIIEFTFGITVTTFHWQNSKYSFRGDSLEIEASTIWECAKICQVTFPCSAITHDIELVSKFHNEKPNAIQFFRISSISISKTLNR